MPFLKNIDYILSVYKIRCFTRINRFVPHKIIPSGEGVAIYEATTGPFHREDTQYQLEKI